MPRTCSAHRPTGNPVALALRLDEVAEELGWGTPPMLIGLTDAGTDEIGPSEVGPGPGGDLVAGLVGFDAPPDWRALAVIVPGRAHDLDDRAADPRPVRLVHVVDRAGATGSVLRVAGQEGRPTTLGEGAHGRLVDACRRVLGLATADAPPDSTALWAVQWLDRLLAAAAAGDALAEPAAAARLHPAVELLAVHEPALADEGGRRLVRLGQIMGDAWPWPDLRLAAAGGRWELDGVTAQGAAWMDDGMFARWVLAEYPAPADLLAELERLLPERAAAAVRATCAQWGLE